MEVRTLGGQDPEFALVGALHADEREGAIAIRRLFSGGYRFRRPVKCLVVNEDPPDERWSRSEGPDLNRVFGEDGTTSVQETAREIARELRDCKVLDIHSTESYDEPFLVLQNLTETKRDLAATTGVSVAVDATAIAGTGLVGRVEGVALECGRKGTEAARENAAEVAERFLAGNGVLDGEATRSDPTVYRIFDAVPDHSADGASVELHAANFELVREGTTYAHVADRPLVADRDFYPVLMSEDGYPDIIGFMAERLGPLSELSIGDRSV